ncbi:MAG: hypothetical protein AAF805_12310, partial [Planctomycetota bacterium]
PDRWYVWSDVGGLYRSDDDARTWRALHQGLPDGQGDTTNVRDFYEHPANPRRLVLVTGTRWRAVGGVWVSDDAGASWRKSLEDLFWGNAHGRQHGSTLVADPRDPDRLLVAGQRGVFQSEDGGASWTRADCPDRMNPVAVGFDPARPDRCWISSEAIDTWTQGERFAVEAALLVSDDRGAIWRRVSGEAPREVVCDPSDDRRWIGTFDARVRESRDGGLTWSDLHEGLPSSSPIANAEINPTQAYALETTAAAVLLANGQGDVFRLPAGGERWRPIRRRRVTAPRWWYGNHGQSPGWVHFGKSASSLRVDPRDDRRWLMTDWYAVWETRNAGRTWRFSGDGLENTVLHGVAVDPADPTHVLVFMGDNGMFHSRDGGRTLVRNRFPDKRLESNVRQVVFCLGDPSTVWAIGNTNPGQWECSSIGVSGDSGRTWRYAGGEGLPAGRGETLYHSAIAAHPERPDTAWVTVSGEISDGGGVYATNDRGRTWRAVCDGLPGGVSLFSGNIWDRGPELSVGPEGALMAISKSARAAYRLGKGETRWSLVRDCEAAPQSVVADPHRVGRWWMACGGDGLLMTDDGGATWATVLSNAADEAACDPLVADRVAVSSPDGVRVSRDGGETWRRVGQELPHRESPTIALARGTTAIGTKGNGVFVRSRPSAAPTR